MTEQRYGVDVYTKTYGRDRVFTALAGRYGDRYLRYRDAWRKAGPDWHPDFPLNIIFDLVDRCNQVCPQCLRAPDLITDYDGFLGTKRVLPYEVISGILDECGASGLPSINFGGSGECTLHPDFIRICQKVMDIDVCEFRIITNGLRLKDDIAEALIDMQAHIVSVSIDAFSSETYAISRGNASQYQPVVDNVIAFAERKRARGVSWPLLRVSFVKQDGNAHEADQFADFWSQYADMVEIQSFSDYRMEEGFNNDFECMQPFQRMIVWAYGGAGPCCGFPGIVYNIGDYQQQTISEIWHGEAMESMRQMMRTKNYEPACQQCMGTRVVV
jgi:radical SAM protein with 4Fe4S-binding SPASM domain